MEKQATKGRPRPKILIILGFLSIGILFLIYSRFVNPGVVTPETISAFERIAFGFYIILFMAFGGIAYGLYRFHKQKAGTNKNDALSIIASSIFNIKSRRIFLVSFIGYGAFFSLTSGILVYQPEVTFSYHYNAVIPSAHITPCCGEPGYMPKLIVYITEHLGLQIIPINLVLQLVVSYLVGLNVSLAVLAFNVSKRSGGASGVGATTGLFIACPTCVGTFLSLFVGTSSVVTFTLAVTQLQTIFILVTIPVLLATPFIMARKLRANKENCQI